ncbi:MAG: hypothetical protein IKN53_00010 [Oscillibacter sp.]|nr:hypothetical protein [Oscillibacter sp.]
MNEVFEREWQIGPGVCDEQGLLSYADAFRAFQDAATFHAEELGVGLREIGKRDLFWVTVKTQVRFFRRPRMIERVIVRTWPEAPERMRGNRSYEIVSGDEVLVAGKTEWVTMNMKTHAVAPMRDLYPAELTFSRPSACAEPFARIADDFDGAEPFCRHRVRSTDIDLGGHMNNIAYVRAMLGGFSLAELEARPVKRADVVFRTICYEGETLLMQRRETENGTDVRMSKDGATVLLARLERAEN